MTLTLWRTGRLAAFVCLGLLGVAASACSTPPKPHELQAFEQLRAQPQVERAEEIAPNHVGRADHLLSLAREHWQDNELQDAIQTSLMGQAAVNHALALAEQEQAHKRSAAARKKLSVANEEIKKLESELEALTNQVALLERLEAEKANQAALQKQIAEHQELAASEQQRLSEELKRERLRTEALDKIKAAELAVKEAESFGAPQHAAELFAAAQDVLERARREIGDTQFEAARVSADLATQKAEQATEAARPLYTAEAKVAAKKAMAEALARDAAALASVEVRRDTRGALQRLVLHISSKQLFKGRRATKMVPESGQILASVSALLKDYAEFPVQVLGHTDNRGRSDLLLARSLARAEAVYSSLIGYGVAAGRMVVAGKGGEEPIENNRSSAGRARNNRVEIVFLYQ